MGYCQRIVEKESVCVRASVRARLCVSAWVRFCTSIHLPGCYYIVIVVVVVVVNIVVVVLSHIRNIGTTVSNSYFLQTSAVCPIFAYCSHYNGAFYCSVGVLMGKILMECVTMLLMY